MYCWHRVCLLSLCVSYHSHGQTYRLEFWYVGQMDGYLGQVHMSRSCVKDQDIEVKKHFNGYFNGCLQGNRHSNISVRNTTTWAVL